MHLEPEPAQQYKRIVTSVIRPLLYSSGTSYHIVRSLVLRLLLLLLLRYARSLNPCTPHRNFQSDRSGKRIDYAYLEMNILHCSSFRTLS